MPRERRCSPSGEKRSSRCSKRLAPSHQPGRARYQRNSLVSFTTNERFCISGIHRGFVVVRPSL